MNRQTITYPLSFFSATQMDLWESNPEGFINKYIYNIPTWEGPWLMFGRRFAKMRAGELPPTGDNVNEVLKQFRSLPLPEKRIEHCLKNCLNCVIKVDSMDHIGALFQEDKTTSTGWTEEQVQESTQMNFYAAILYHEFGTLYRGQLQYAMTEKCDISAVNPEGVRFTGEVKTIPYEASLTAVQLFTEHILKVANDIAWMASHIRDGIVPPDIEMSVLVEYLKAERMKLLAERTMKRLKDQVIHEMTAKNFPYFKAYGGRLKVTKSGKINYKPI